MALHDPGAFTAQWGPDLPITGFAGQEFFTYGYDETDEVTPVSGVNIVGHVKSVNRGGFIQLVLHWQSPSLAPLNMKRKAAAAPGGNVAATLVCTDLSGLSVYKLTKARLQSRPSGSYSTTGPSARTFKWHGERLEVDELGFVE